LAFLICGCRNAGLFGRTVDTAVEALRGTDAEAWRRSADQLGEPAWVLCDGRQRELVLCDARPSKPKANKLQNALEVGKWHLDALAIAA
jgi:hypothetical protein